MSSRSSTVTGERLAFARERLLAFDAAGDAAARAREKRMKALGSAVAGAVPELRARGVTFSVCVWLAGGGEERELAAWCCEWFFIARSLKQLECPAPRKTLECVQWLLEREPAELRFLERETEALIEQIKDLAKGYALELKAAAGAGA